MSSRTRLLPLVAHAVCMSTGFTAVGVPRVAVQGLGAAGQRLYLALLQNRSNASSAANEFDHEIKRLALILEVRQTLRDKSLQQDCIPYPELEALLIERGLAHDAREAMEVSKALHRAGITVFHNEDVYLRPETFVSRKPDLDFPTVEYLEVKLSQINAKLQTLESERQQRELNQQHLKLLATRQADIKVQRLLYYGLLFLLLRMAIMYYLTFEELSWDVMEPCAYLISLGDVIIGYAYFLWTKGHVFDLKPFKDYWTNYYLGQLVVEKALKGGAHDQVPQIEKLKEEEYHRLLQARERYTRLLEAARVLQQHTSYPRVL